MLVFLLVVVGGLGLCLLIGVGIGNIQHMLTASCPRAASAAPAKALAPSIAATSPDGEVDVGPAMEPAKAPLDSASGPLQTHSTEPSLAQALAMEHVNS